METIKLKIPIMVLGPQAGKMIECKELHFPEQLTGAHVKFFPKAFLNGGNEVEPNEVIPFLSGPLQISRMSDPSLKGP